MKTAATLAPPLLADAGHDSARWSAIALKTSAYISLTKPRIGVAVLLTVAVGFFLGAHRSSDPSVLLLTLVGTGLVASGASVWNQYLERFRDARMKRTAGRPLPTGRVSPAEAAIFGTVITAGGVGLLLLGPHPIAAGVALVTFVLYAFVYTPLKPITTLNTAIGAVPGALPPVIGWAAATGRLGPEAAALFLIMFLWQFPHFLAIAWIYREDYARGGHKMLPNVDPLGAMTGRQAAAYALSLIPVGLLPSAVGLAGMGYFIGALVLGVFYLVAASRFWFDVCDATARKLLRASFVYLLAILLLLLSNPLPV
jgi:protoheme IX farnesyltransferase